MFSLIMLMISCMLFGFNVGGLLYSKLYNMKSKHLIKVIIVTFIIVMLQFIMFVIGAY